MKYSLLLIPILGILLTCCISRQDSLYIQENSFSRDSLSFIYNLNEPYRLQTNDVLSIKVKSLDPTNASVFNLEDGSSFQQVSPSYLYLNGYSIDYDGNINMPVMGKINVVGLTLNEARERVQQELDEYLRDATVLVNLVSFKISVLGEVNNPGYYYIFNNQLNIFEALSLAGDMLEFANRKKVTLVRQLPNGSDGIILDLTDPNIFASPYYYIRPNDLIYVEPLESKPKRSNLEVTSLFNTIFVGVTTTITVILLINQFSGS